MTEESMIESMEQLIRLAKKGKQYDGMVKRMSDNINTIKSESKEKSKEHFEKIGKLYKTIVELKSTHQDYEKVQCPSCGGEGGFSWEDGHGGGGGEICGECMGEGISYVKKEEK